MSDESEEKDAGSSRVEDSESDERLAVLEVELFKHFGKIKPDELRAAIDKELKK